jgi:hypothetical protein
LLFDKIPEAGQDMDILRNQVDTLPRLAIAISTDPNLGLTEFIQAWCENFPPVNASATK